MKSVVQKLPEEDDKILQYRAKGDFFVDPETYCSFRDEILLKELKNYIKEKNPGKWKSIEDVSGVEEFDSDTQKLLTTSYFEYNKIRERFYLYRGEFYSYGLMGFGNEGITINLIKYDKDDVVRFLNHLNKKQPKKDEA